MKINIKRGFNLKKLQTLPAKSRAVFNFTCDIKCDRNLDFHIVCLDTQNKCTSHNTEIKPYVWYNE